MAVTKSGKERLKEITAGIENGIRELFQSEKYRQYLAVMGRFHNYSVNNTILIHMQRPDATLVAGYTKWKTQFGRHVKYGEKGIQVIAPTPYKKKVEEMKLDPDTNEPMRDMDGNIIIEEKIIQVPMFKVVSVFDLAQTDGKPLPQLSAALTGDVKQYEVFLEALQRSSPVPISMKPLKDDLDGFFSLNDQSITIREGMSEVQTICAVIHEIAHSKLHNTEMPVPEDALKYQEVRVMGMPALFSTGRISQKDVPESMFRYELRGSEQEPGIPVTAEQRVLSDFAGTILTCRPLPLSDDGILHLSEDIRNSFDGDYLSIPAFHNSHRKDKQTQEVEAESISYAVCKYYSIETAQNSFGYIASWSKTKELKELRASLETINKTASGLINDIDRHFAEICKERGIDMSKQAGAEQEPLSSEKNEKEALPEEPDVLTEEPGALPEKPVVLQEQEDSIKDLSQSFATDFTNYLEQLYQNGKITNPFLSYSKQDMEKYLVEEALQHGYFDGTRQTLEEAVNRNAMADQANALLSRLEKLSDKWDAALSFQIEASPFASENGQQDLSGLSPEELYEKYVDAYQRIQRKHDGSAPKVPPAKARVINRGI